MIAPNRLPARGGRFAAPGPAPAIEPPASRTNLDELIARHRATWLRDAEATLTVLDWRAFTGGRTIHVLDARDLGAPISGYLGFATQAQLHELAANFIPFKPSTKPAAAVAVNVDALVPCLRIHLTTEARQGAAIDTIRAAVAAVAGHELAHVFDAQACGRRLAESTTLEAMVQTLANGQAYTKTQQVAAHAPGWVRAYAHLLTRAASLRGHDQWLAAFRRDVGLVLPRHPHEYLDALGPELVQYTADDLLVDILRQPAPSQFVDLFSCHTTAAAAAKEP